MKYTTREREAGNIIEWFSTYEEAVAAVKQYEECDKEEGIFEADFYEIVANEPETTEEPFEISVAVAVMEITKVVASETRLPSDRHIFNLLWDMYKDSSCVCAEAVCHAIKGYAESYNWESVRRLARAMELVEENAI